MLGPLAVERDGEPVTIGSGKQRTLLIRLMIDVGRFVPVDVLVDDLWPEDPPPGATGTFRTYVSHLRRALGGGSADEVIRSAQGKGYALDVPPESIDAVRFESLATAGRERLGSGDLAGALEALDGALLLWRGEPLADVMYEEFARAEVTRLTETYLGVKEDRFQVLLDAGRHGEVVGAVEAFVAAHPLRERPVGQLMLALYRSGRAAEALAAYQSYRDALAEETGLDPTSQLQQLQAGILQQSPELDALVRGRSVPPDALARPAEAHAGEPTADAVGHRLPGRLSSFVGRGTEQQRLAEFLTRARLVTLVGPGGAGKTTLAVETIRDGVDLFPDGVWFVSLAGETEAEHVALTVSRAMGMNSDALSAPHAVATKLDGRRALVILDNCEHLADACAWFAERLLGAAADVRILATSREALGVPGELQMTVPPLGTAEAVALFMDRAGSVRPELDLHQHEEDIRRICDGLDGMPLAIELAAARITSLSPSDIADRLDDRFALLTAGARTADARHRTLRAVVDWSHDLLDPDEQALFRRLAIFSGGWSLDAAEAVCVLSGSSDVLGLLGRLVDRSLIVTEGKRFRFLETVRVYASERLEESGEEPELAARHAAYYTRLAEEAEPLLRGPLQRTALARLRDDDQNLRAALAWGRRHATSDPDIGLQLAASLGWYWYVGRQIDGRTELAGMLEAAPVSGDEVRAQALQALSLSLRPGGCIVHPSPTAARAALESASLFDRVGDHGRAALSRIMGTVEAVDGENVEEALQLLADAREVAAREGDDWVLALSDFVEMEILLHHGGTEEALHRGRAAMARFDSLQDAWGRSAVRLHLGIGLRLGGDLDNAGRELLDAVAISRETGLVNNLSRALAELGAVAVARSEVEDAGRWFDEATGAAEELGDPLLMGVVASGRGDLARLLGDASEAERHYQEAAELLQGAERNRIAARAAIGRAAVAVDTSAFGTAIRLLDEASLAAEELNDVGLRAAVLDQRARVAAAEGDAGGAAELLDEASALRSRHGRPRTDLEQRDVEAVLASGQSTAVTR